MTKKILIYIRENIKEITMYACVYFIAVVVGIVAYNVFPIGHEYEESITNTLNSTKVANFAGINIITNGIKQNALFLFIALFAIFTYISSIILSSLFVVKGISTGIYISSLYSILGPIRGTEFVFLDVLIPQVFCVFGFILFATLITNIKKTRFNEPLNILSISIFSLSLMSFSIAFEQLVSSVCINIYTNIN